MVDVARVRWLFRITLVAALLSAAGCATHKPLPYSYAVEKQRPMFQWPVGSGAISSPFGMRHGVMHEGIDIAAPVGTPVHAAGAGKVIYTGTIHGYGRVVILQHADHYVTIYAHNFKDLVRDGETVRRGQVICEVGRTGHTTGANLHFEVRHNNIATNPLAYLPPPVSEQTRLARDSAF